MHRFRTDAERLGVLTQFFKAEIAGLLDPKEDHDQLTKILGVQRRVSLPTRGPEAVRLMHQLEFDFVGTIDATRVPPGPERTALLGADWFDSCFVVADFADCESWLRKAQAEHRCGRTVVMLLPARTASTWFHTMVLGVASEVRFVKGTLKLHSAGPASKGATASECALVVFRGPSRAAPRGPNDRLRLTCTQNMVGPGGEIGAELGENGVQIGEEGRLSLCEGLEGFVASILKVVIFLLGYHFSRSKQFLAIGVMVYFSIYLAALYLLGADFVQRVKGIIVSQSCIAVVKMQMSDHAVIDYREFDKGVVVSAGLVYVGMHSVMAYLEDTYNNTDAPEEEEGSVAPLDPASFPGDRCADFNLQALLGSAEFRAYMVAKGQEGGRREEFRAYKDLANRFHPLSCLGTGCEAVAARTLAHAVKLNA
ncbi:Uncharacterized protein SCF082_LOCUS53050 [Durusdinium trenchii]|uniref:Solute carrier family 40 protein n=1 Tax=Durusdinium trenchii TaxID=1381693 RepID=A0ABP0SQJ8_9DINO